jgi:hypothetical protein
MFGLAHFDSTPLIYGVMMFIGIWSMWAKFIGGRWLGLIIEISIFVLVFKLHGGSMAGGFAAMVAAMIAGFVLPRTLK